jgi:hypothetical protein
LALTSVHFAIAFTCVVVIVLVLSTAINGVLTMLGPMTNHWP